MSLPSKGKIFKAHCRLQLSFEAVAGGGVGSWEVLNKALQSPAKNEFTLTCGSSGVR